MLDLPEKGIKRSVEQHNCRVDVVADWIEGSALFMEERVSRSDVIDVICENHVYRHQDFAVAFLVDVWAELQRRSRLDGIGALVVEPRAVEPQGDWTANLAHSFCLLLSLRNWYPSWADRHDNSYIEQGELFERLTEQSLSARGWRLLRTGWSATQVNKLSKIVSSVSSHLGEPINDGGIGRWTTKDANDAGLDLVCERPFGDARGGRPLFFFQCASGANWSEKTRTPDVRLWTKLIDFSNDPQRGFALPYALSEKDFLHTCGSVNGMVLDRQRLVSPLENDCSAWIDSALGSDLKTWMKPRMDDLPSER